jgi:hypothetical protein
MTLNRSLHHKFSVQRMYLPREQEGKVLTNLGNLHDGIVLGVTVGILRDTDALIRLGRSTSGKGLELFYSGLHVELPKITTFFADPRANGRSFDSRASLENQQQY